MTQLTFAELSGFSPEDFPARTFPLPEKARASKGSGADSGAKCSASSANADPLLSSLKTFLRLEIEARTGYSATWKEQATPEGRSWSVLTASARPTEESASGLWASPRNSPGSIYAESSETHNIRDKKGGATSIAREAVFWPTPTVQDGENIAGQSQEGRNSFPLNTEARLWPTPQAQNSKGIKAEFAPQTPGGKWIDTRNGQPVQTSLDQEMKLWPTPTTRSQFEERELYSQGGEPLTRAASRTFLPHETTSEAGLLLQKWNRPSCPVLNERFAEWLMNYPRNYCQLSESELVGLMLKSKPGGRKTRSKSAGGAETKP